MIFTTMRTRSFPEDRFPKLLEALNDMTRRIRDVEVSGFVQAYLLSDREGGATVMSVWRSYADLEAFLRSEAGHDALEVQSLLGEVEVEESRSLWQATFEESPREPSLKEG